MYKWKEPVMLDNYQILNEGEKPRYAVLDYKDFVKIKEILTDVDKLEDYLDYLVLNTMKSQLRLD